MPVKLLSVKDSELEKVVGGLKFEENNDDCLCKVIVSDEEYKCIKPLGYSCDQALTVGDVNSIRSRFLRLGFLKKGQMNLAQKFSAGVNYNDNYAKLVVVNF